MTILMIVAFPDHKSHPYPISQICLICPNSFSSILTKVAHHLSVLSLYNHGNQCPSCQYRTSFNQS